MAWLYQRGKRWWIGYYDENGKRVRKSIGTSKEAAELTLKRVEAELAKKNARPLAIPDSALEVMQRQFEQLETRRRELLARRPSLQADINSMEIRVKQLEAQQTPPGLEPLVDAASEYLANIDRRAELQQQYALEYLQSD